MIPHERLRLCWTMFWSFFALTLVDRSIVAYSSCILKLINMVFEQPRLRVSLFVRAVTRQSPTILPSETGPEDARTDGVAE